MSKKKAMMTLKNFHGGSIRISLFLPPPKLAVLLIFGKDKAYAKLKTSLRRKKINKFKESAWKTFYSLSAEILAILVIYNEPWFSNTKYFWTGPGDQVWPDQKMNFGRVGAVVLALHEGSDVFLETAKISKYSGLQTLANILFTILLFLGEFFG